MIHLPQKLTHNNRTFYHQDFTPDNINPDEAYRLYDQDGDFIAEFETFQALIDYVTHLTPDVK